MCLETNSLVRVNNGLAPIYQTNWKNFQPRVGFAWDPFKDGKTSIRAAYAILADQPVTNLVTGNATNPPFATCGGLTDYDSDDHSFQRNQCGRSRCDCFTKFVRSRFRKRLRSIVELQHCSAKSNLAGHHRRILRFEGNPSASDPKPESDLSKCRAGGHAAISQRFSPTSPIAPGVPLQNITFRESTGNSSYNALWVTATKRLSHGLQFNASYTFSKSIDYNSQSSQGVTLQDSNNIKGDRGLSDFDARHRFVISGLYELPFSRKIAGWMAGSFRRSCNRRAATQSHFWPATPERSGDPAANANSLTGLATLRPDLGARSPSRPSRPQPATAFSGFPIWCAIHVRRILSGRAERFCRWPLSAARASITSAVSGATR